MAESEDMKDIVNQVAVQAAIAVMMVLRDTDVGSYSKPERATEAEAWWTSPRKALIQLECTR